MAGGTRPCVPPCDESGLKPSLATTHAKAFAPCDATLWAGRTGPQPVGAIDELPLREQATIVEGADPQRKLISVRC
ncbi:hypothetical protein [Desulfosporosinus sp. I2]|uniref:hypothetical protein n=1 Tax=Desulfosporosinus sp. I2 TaxID=1617025 RepID=UPI0012E0A5EE|nr:hypothetical protein [Desulfosporosinus sp. I2]